MRKQNNHREAILICGMSTYGKSNYANELAYNYNRVVCIDPMMEYDGKYFRSVSRLADHINGNPFYRVTTNDLRNFDKICGILIKNSSSRSRITLLVDEITRLELDGKLKNFKNFRNIVYGGGHEGIDIIAVTQRFSDFPKALRASSWTKIVCFRQSDEDDLRRLKKITSKETAGEISKLQTRSFIEISNQKIERGNT